VVFAPVMILAGTGLIMFYYSRLQSNRSIFLIALLPIFRLALSAGLEFVEAKLLSTLAEDSIARYQQFSFIEEMAELVSATFFVWIHYQYGIWVQRDAGPNEQ
jgi:hypothetical protein